MWSESQASGAETTGKNWISLRLHQFLDTNGRKDREESSFTRKVGVGSRWHFDRGIPCE